MSVIYVPKGKAKEYGDYALNIYEGCPHECVYCFAPAVTHKEKCKFHSEFKVRENIIERTREDLEKNFIAKGIIGKHIHLCFSCDPFPNDCDHSVTREIIRLIHDSGNFVQILTKGKLENKDWSVLAKGDIFGVTITTSHSECATIEPKAAPTEDRKAQLFVAKKLGMRTFVSCEPVFNQYVIWDLIEECDFIDEYKIGKLNYMAKDNPLYPKCIGTRQENLGTPLIFSWGDFGRECERLCKLHNRKYYIKENLRAEMEKAVENV